MKLFSLTFILSFTFATSLAQLPDYHNFSGFLTTSDKQVISFKIMLNTLEDGEFDGYSVTNYDGDDYTKSLITGELSYKDKKMSFKEISNAETKSKAEQSSFCYINAPTLVISRVGRQEIISGQFEGLYPSGETCATGSVLLIYKEEIKEKVDSVKIESLDTLISNIETKDSIPEDLILTSNEELSISKWGDDVVIEIWDGNYEDNDAVSVYLNDELIREKIILKSKKTQIKLPKNDNTFRLKIVALSEGRYGINTLNLKIWDSENKNEYVSELNKGESFSIQFQKN